MRKHMHLRVHSLKHMLNEPTIDFCHISNEMHLIPRRAMGTWRLQLPNAPADISVGAPVVVWLAGLVRFLAGWLSCPVTGRVLAGRGVGWQAGWFRTGRLPVGGAGWPGRAGGRRAGGGRAGRWAGGLAGG